MLAQAQGSACRSLHIARAGQHRLVLPVRDPIRGETLRQTLLAADARAIDTPPMDLASLHSVRACVAALGADPDLRFDGVLFNADAQSANRIEFTVDGIESTFAINHLAHHLLATDLIRQLNRAAIVGWTASGTHDRRERSARLFGFRGARYTTAARLVRGDYEPGTTVTQACKDAYATSKLCNILSARAFAARHSDVAKFFSFDPGLMPGTSLAREQPRLAQWAWHTILPRLAAVIPGTSTAQASGALLAALLMQQRHVATPGEYSNYTGSAREPALPPDEHRLIDDLFATSSSLHSSASMSASLMPCAVQGSFLCPASKRMNRAR